MSRVICLLVCFFVCGDVKVASKSGNSGKIREFDAQSGKIKERSFNI